MAQRNDEPTRRVDTPEPGIFLVRLVKGGPLVIARIDLIDGLWSAEIDGEPCGLPDADPVRADGVFRVWHWGRRVNESGAPLTEADYLHRIGLKHYVRAHAPEHPAATPDEPIDLDRLPSLF